MTSSPFSRTCSLRTGVTLTLSLLTASVAGSSTAQASTRTPISVRLSLPEDLPTLGEPFDVQAVVLSHRDAPGTMVLAYASATGVRILGDTRRRLDLAADREVTFPLHVVIDSYGDHEVALRARHVVDAASEVWGDLGAVYFNASPGGTTRGFGPVRDGGIASLSQPEGNPALLDIDPAFGLASSPSALPPRAPDAPAPGGTIPPPLTASGAVGCITARIQLLGRDPSDTPIQVGEMLAEVLNATTNASLAYFVTDATGFGEITFTNPGLDGFYVRFWAYVNWNVSPGEDNQMVVRPTASEGWWEAHKVWTPGFFGYSDGTFDLGTWAITSGDSRRGAFSLLNDVNDAFLYVLWNGGTSPEGVQVHWQADSVDGAYFNGEVHLRGDDWGTVAAPPPSDTAIHEYGHAMMYHVYGDTLPPNDCTSPHYIELSSGINCGWIEGWADFVALAANDDTRYTWPSGAFLDLETPTFGTPGWDVGATVEGHVAGSLLDILDSSNEGTDQLSLGFDEIWTVVYNWNNNRFSEFFHSWRLSFFEGCSAAKAMYQNTIVVGSGPTFFEIPDIACYEDSICENIRDLRLFASDDVCSFEDLTFGIAFNTDPRVGVTIDSSAFIDVRPDPNFFGSSTIVVLATNPVGDTAFDFVTVTILPVNDAPSSPPVPVGPAHGATSVAYGFSASATDVDGDTVQIRFDWDDGTVSSFSSTVDPGVLVANSHAYSGEGVYQVRAQARDGALALSAWSDAMPIEIADAAARWGTVNADGGGSPVRVLFVNGSAGSPSTGEMSADNDAPLDVSLVAAPAGPASQPKYALWGWLTYPTSTSDTVLPHGLGTMCMAPLLSSCGALCPVYGANPLGHCARALCSTAEATGAVVPGVVLRVPAGRLPAGTVVTFQGVIKDLSDVSYAQHYSVTNAVVVTMTE